MLHTWARLGSVSFRWISLGRLLTCFHCRHYSSCKHVSDVNFSSVNVILESTSVNCNNPSHYIIFFKCLCCFRWRWLVFQVTGGRKITTAVFACHECESSKHLLLLVVTTVLGTCTGHSFCSSRKEWCIICPCSSPKWVPNSWLNEFIITPSSFTLTYKR